MIRLIGLPFRILKALLAAPFRLFGRLVTLPFRVLRAILPRRSKAD